MASTLHSKSSLLRASNCRSPFQAIRKPCHPRQMAQVPAHTMSTIGARNLQHTRQGCFGHSASCRPATRVQAKPATAGEFEVTQQNLPGCVVQLTITVPASIVQKCHKKVLNKLRELVGPVPGFPKNKPLPEGIIVDRCGGPKKYKMAVLEEVLLNSYSQVMERYNNVMYPDSDRMMTNVEGLVDGLSLDNSLVYEVQFDVLPAVKWKRPYKDIQVSIEDTGNDETDAEATEEFIRQELKKKGFQRVVQGRGLQQGDLAVIDMDIRREGAAQPLPGLNKEMFMFDTDEDPLGLSPNLEGMTPGEKREFAFNFPEDWHNPLMQGAEAEAKIKVHELFQWVLPEFDDEFVKQHFPQYETAAAMRQAVLMSTKVQRFTQRDDDIQDSFFRQLLELVDVQVPDSMIEDVGRNEFQRTVLMSIAKGELKMQQLDELTTEEKVNGYISANREELTNLAKAQLAKEEIIEAEGLKVSEELLNAEIEDAKRNMQAQGMEYDEERVREQAEEVVRGAMLMEWIKNNIKIDIKPYVAGPAA